ncbi:hypothetical protein RI444_15515 [Paenarthrobacter sp. AT5]|uniref:hypothetical protein n=1 Tax=Paenarthrobacter TaxID=1742992 RepID=UPI001A9984E4|nr:MULTISPECIES: hypothetical protein [Paenarthrobacter]QSZ53259.1 hypothetical protein AYX19_09755 [Paenarthrobacter ureafaciens]WOC59916.1 hypothetical protein RI444_15515 [Paenarthrobacter sp. AT5]
MTRLRISLQIEIEAEDTVFQEAALTVPAEIGMGADFTAPFEASSDPVKAGFILITGIQNDLVDKLPAAKEVLILNPKIETIGH